MKVTKENKPQQSRVIDNPVIYSTKIIQKATKIFTQEGQQYSWNGNNTIVGDVVEVGLDPIDMIQGQSANLNNAQDDMMKAIRQYWGINGGDIVKGHLWNDNLGGSALNINLFTITRAANKDHLTYVENLAKRYIYNGFPIYYKVEVDAEPRIDKPIAEFDCEIHQWNPYKPTIIGPLLAEPITIRSDLNDVGAYNEAYETYTGYSPDKIKAPKLPKWLKRPKTKVGELTKNELFSRNSQ